MHKKGFVVNNKAFIIFTKLKSKLPISYRVSSAAFNIIFYVYPESEKHVKDHRRPQSKKGNIYKIPANHRCGNAHLFAYGSADTKYLPLYKVFYFIHK